MLREFIDFWLKKTFFKRRIWLLRKKQKLYSEIREPSDIYGYQLARFNEIWEHAYSQHPFYTEWKRRHKLPNKILSIRELKNFPVLTKRDLADSEVLILSNLSNYKLTTTGGTSGITLAFPVSRFDADHCYVNAYLGRSWWSIEPFSKVLMFWGHSHLFGHGFLKVIAKGRRKLSDLLINTQRVSSYSLHANNLQFFYERLTKSRAEVIIGYASNLFKVCKHIQENGLEVPRRGKFKVIVTSETCARADENLISKTLGAKVIQEYGMAETGVIAYSENETNQIKVLWDSFIIINHDDIGILVTTINDKCFPLINYATEDIVDVGLSFDTSVLSFRSIIGKKRDILEVKKVSGETVHVSVILFDHVLKYISGIYSVTYEVNDELIFIHLEVSQTLDLDSVEKIFKQKISSQVAGIDFDSIKFRQNFKLGKTIAGKRTTILKEGSFHENS